MVKVSIKNNVLTLISEKAIEEKIIKIMDDKTFMKKFGSRISHWLKDYYAEHVLYDGQSRFSRSYRTSDLINPNGLELTIATLQSDHMKFLDFLTSLIEEDEKNNLIKNLSSENDKTTQPNEEEKFIHIRATDNGYCISGNINVIAAIGILTEVAIQTAEKNKHKNEKNNKNNN